MRILHIADLHLGQTLYHHYLRHDEHEFFFSQLNTWIQEYKPDALLVCGDIFDIPRPSASIWQLFTRVFVDIHNILPEMRIVIISGNHDSPSALQSHNEIWKLANTYLIGSPPPVISTNNGWEEKFIIRLKNGYIVGVPYMSGDRIDVYDRLMEYVESENINNLPVVMTGHLTVRGSNTTGHSDQIGNLKSVDATRLGNKFDYMALGHIHRPQTIAHISDSMKDNVQYSSPVIRYSGSVIHVSCDENYTHSVTLVDLDKHGGTVKLKQLWIDQLRHFYVLPSGSDKSFSNEKEALKGIMKFAETHSTGYLRIKMDYRAELSSDFNNQVYTILEADGKDLRFNPKIIWTGKPDSETDNDSNDERVIDVTDLQQMTDPMDFVLATINDYPTLSKEEIYEMFKEINDFISNQE